MTAPDIQECRTIGFGSEEIPTITGSSDIFHPHGTGTSFFADQQDASNSKERKRAERS